jgi:hypothetical protein
MYRVAEDWSRAVSLTQCVSRIGSEKGKST